MKRLLLATAVLGLSGAFGSANAVPIGAAGSGAQTTDLGIWSNNTNGTATDPLNQALPSARVGLVSTGTHDPASGPINFNLSGTSPSTIGAFLASSPGFAAPGCTGGCLTTNLSGNLGQFNHASLFEFSFTVTDAGTLSVTHDDGVSLFADGGGGNNPTGSDLFPMGASAPTFVGPANTVHLAPGSYDLFYTSANGLPEVLQTDFVSDIHTPEPGSLVILGSALVGLGWLARRRRRAA
jgi:hypothetical protein